MLGEVLEGMEIHPRRLSKSHQKIADYINCHYDQVLHMTAERLGECVSVSESTVVRFATAMGYDGYPAFQQALRQRVIHRLTPNQRVALAGDLSPEDAPGLVLKKDMQNLRFTMESLDHQVFHQVVGRLLEARRIFVMGLRSASPLAQFLGHYLHFLFEDVRLVSNGTSDVFESISRIGAQDVLLAISFPRYSNRTMDAMRFARKNGAQVVALTDGPMSPLCAVADATLMARTDMTSFVDSLAAPLSLINALLVTLGIHREGELKDHFRQLERIWDEHQVYLEEEGIHG